MQGQRKNHNSILNQEKVAFKPGIKLFEYFTLLDTRREKILQDVDHTKVIPEPLSPRGYIIRNEPENGVSIIVYVAATWTIVIP